MKKLKSFRVKEVLMSDACHKNLCLLLETNEGENAILSAEKTPLPVGESEVNSILSQSIVEPIVENNIYESSTLYMPKEFNGVKSTLIYPCTDQHIEKYRDHVRCFVQETADDYSTITLPYLESNQFSIEWLMNVLDKKAEVDRIVYDDVDPVNGFMLLPDIKWDGINLENLYVQAIVYQRNLKSIRDLTSEHLPLLNNIKEKGGRVIEERYGLPRNQIRIFFHYQPSYYHLHVHFIRAAYDAPGIHAGKAILLDDVINNLTLMPGYYQKASLTFIIKQNHPLAELLRKSK